MKLTISPKGLDFISELKRKHNHHSPRISIGEPSLEKSPKILNIEPRRKIKSSSKSMSPFFTISRVKHNINKGVSLAKTRKSSSNLAFFDQGKSSLKVSKNIHSLN